MVIFDWFMLVVYLILLSMKGFVLLFTRNGLKFYFLFELIYLSSRLIQLLTVGGLKVSIFLLFDTKEFVSLCYFDFFAVSSSKSESLVFLLYLKLMSLVQLSDYPFSFFTSLSSPNLWSIVFRASLFYKRYLSLKIILFSSLLFGIS